MLEILLTQMRREGFEMTVSPPKVVIFEITGLSLIISLTLLSLHIIDIIFNISIKIATPIIPSIKNENVNK